MMVVPKPAHNWPVVSLLAHLSQPIPLFEEVDQRDQKVVLLQVQALAAFMKFDLEIWK